MRIRNVISVKPRTSTDANAGSSIATKRQPWSVPIAAAVLLLVVVVPIVREWGGVQQASRYVLTAAVWDHRTFSIDQYSHILGIDRAERDGVTYSDKAPGQPLLAIPFYGIYRLVGGTPAEDPGPGPNWGLWWVTLWTAGVPAALLLVLMYRWARDHSPKTALAAALSLSFGSLLFVYATLLFGHVLGGLALFAMFLLVRSRSASTERLLLAGLVGGGAVVIEYPLALAVGVITVIAIWLHKRRTLWVGLGGTLMAALLGVYNWALFGSPLTLSYQWTAFLEVREQPAETLEIFAGPSIERVVDVLFGSRGLLMSAPVLALAIGGLALMWRRGVRFDVFVAVAVLLSLLAVQFSWGNSFAGGAGPRYVTPALPFLAAPLAAVWARWRIATPVLAAVSVVTMVLAAYTDPELASDLDGGLGFWLRSAFQGRLEETIFTLRFGPIGWALHGMVMVSAVALVWNVWRADQDGRGNESNGQYARLS